MVGGAGLGGCSSLQAALATPQTDALRAQPPAGLPRQNRLDAVPFFPDDSTLCGPATMAAVLAHAGQPVALETLREQVYLPGREGSLQIEMLAAARRHGVIAMTLAPRLDAALQELAGGLPVLLLLNLSLPWVPRWHYAVLVGYDLDRGEVRLHSGTQREAVWPMATLEHTWARSGCWGVVACGSDRLPATATPEALWPALLGLDRTQTPDAASRAWATAWARWPQDLNLTLGWANSRYAAGDRAQAAQGYEAAARTHDSAAAWNNLAQTRWELGQTAAAAEAARRAWQRAQTAEPALQAAVRQTWQELGLGTPP